MDLNPRLFYGQFINATRGVSEKIPWLFAFISRVEDGHYEAQKPRRTARTRSRTLFDGYREFEEEPA